jgi:hypothetical protein
MFRKIRSFLPSANGSLSLVFCDPASATYDLLYMNRVMGLLREFVCWSSKRMCVAPCRAERIDGSVGMLGALTSDALNVLRVSSVLLAF